MNSLCASVSPANTFRRFHSAVAAGLRAVVFPHLRIAALPVGVIYVAAVQPSEVDGAGQPPQGLRLKPSTACGGMRSLARRERTARCDVSCLLPPTLTRSDFGGFF